MTPIEIFMAGFSATFGAGLMGWAASFVRTIIIGGHNE